MTDAVAMEYNESVLGHFRAPRNIGSFPDKTLGVIRGHAGARRLGRELTLELRLAADGDVAECRYRVYGCPATIAVCSLASERLKGQSPMELARFSGLSLAEELDLPATKRAAALLLEDALRAALAEYNMTSRRESA